MSSYTKHFGRVNDDNYKADFVHGLQYPNLARDVPKLMAQNSKREVFLWLPILHVAPAWERQAQGIGDCVSWGAELVMTATLADMARLGMIQWEGEAATEAIYGGCRVEVNGGRSPLGHEDGAAGSWAAAWLKKWGCLVRKDYSQTTGNPEHDLRTYSARRASDWGVNGCGGRSDREALDKVARQFPVQDVSQITTVEAAEAAIDAGCGITIASMIGFEGSRNSEGIIRRSGQWPHQMAILGKKYTPMGEPLFRVFNSWNHSAQGPDPGIEHKAISACSWWITADDMRAILRDDDTFTFGRVKGFDLPPFKWEEHVWI